VKFVDGAVKASPMFSLNLQKQQLKLKSFFHKRDHYDNAKKGEEKDGMGGKRGKVRQIISFFIPHA
jgi:hypothetical protein